MFSLFRRFAQVRRVRAKASLVSGLVQKLESRTLLAAITFSSTTTSITVRGTEGGDEIEVSKDSDSFLVNGVDTGILLTPTRTTLNVNTLGGNDKILLTGLGTSITTTNLDGGGGKDTISGSSSNDTVLIDELDVILDMGDGTDLLRASATSGALDLDLTGTNVEGVYGTNGDDKINASNLTTNVGINALGGNDTIYGGKGNDVIHGNGGDDSITGGEGNDQIFGDAGRDTLEGGDNDDLLYYDDTDVAVDFGMNLKGGDGVDRIRITSYDSPQVTLVLKDLNGLEVVQATNGDDSIDASLVTTSLDIRGMGGNDLIKGGTQGDQIIGGTGNDTVFGGDGDDSISGNAGNDSLIGGNGIDLVMYFDSLAGVDVNLLTNLTSNDGLAGVDTLSGFENVTGSDFNDLLSGDSLANQLIGGKGNDTLVGRDGSDNLQGGLGNDSLNGGNGADSLYGGAGNDTLNGAAGTDLSWGQENDDLIYGDDDEDALFSGGDGSDTLRPTNVSSSVTWVIGSAGFEIVVGSTMNDTIDLSGSGQGLWVQAGNGADTVTGGNGNDSIEGGAGADSLFGGDGADTLLGADGDDTLIGGDGADSIRGGNGNDKLYANLYDITPPFAIGTLSDGDKDTLNGDAGTDEFWGNNITDSDFIVSVIGELKHII